MVHIHVSDQYFAWIEYKRLHEISPTTTESQNLQVLATPSIRFQLFTTDPFEPDPANREPDPAFRRDKDSYLILLQEETQESVLTSLSPL